MKKVLLTATAILSIITAAHAQKWSAGYRTGIEQVNAGLNENSFTNENLLWNHQLFLNRKIVGGLEAEVTASYYHKERNYIISSIWDGPELIRTRNRISTVTVGLYLRYNFYQKNNWRLFGQAGVSSYKSWNRYDGETLQTINGTPTPFSGKDSSPIVLAHALSAGLGASYNISKRFYLNSIMNVDYKTDSPAALSMYGSDFGTSFFIGLGFRF